MPHGELYASVVAGKIHGLIKFLHACTLVYTTASYISSPTLEFSGGRSPPRSQRMASMYAQFQPSAESRHTVLDARAANALERIQDAQQSIVEQQAVLDLLIRQETERSKNAHSAAPPAATTTTTTTESQPAQSSTAAATETIKPYAVYTGTWSGRTGTWHQDNSGTWSLKTPFITDIRTKAFAEMPVITFSNTESIRLGKR